MSQYIIFNFWFIFISDSPAANISGDICKVKKLKINSNIFGLFGLS